MYSSTARTHRILDLACAKTSTLLTHTLKYYYRNSPGLAVSPARWRPAPPPPPIEAARRRPATRGPAKLRESGTSRVTAAALGFLQLQHEDS